MTHQLSELARIALLACTEAALLRLRTELLEPIAAAQLELPDTLTSLQRRLEALSRVELTTEHEPIMRMAIALGRRTWVEALEHRASQTHDPVALRTLEANLAAIDELRLALAEHEPPSLPRLTDYLTLEAALAARESLPLRWLPRLHDPVSRILLDASLFHPDLAHLRDRCALRGLPLALAAMDIDDLRAINSQHGEREVDRRLLPPLLRTLEALVFGRGHAYGFGRDDYAVLLPNADEAEAARLLMQFQAKLTTLDYPGLAVRPTVSIGLVVIMPDDGRTGRELVRAVELAKRYAKDPGGKNCVAVLRADGPVVLDRTP